MIDKMFGFLYYFLGPQLSPLAAAYQSPWNRGTRASHRLGTVRHGTCEWHLWSFARNPRVLVSSKETGRAGVDKVGKGGKE